MKALYKHLEASFLECVLKWISLSHYILSFTFIGGFRGLNMKKLGGKELVAHRRVLIWT